ncbi:MAG: metallophosphoesterase [Myxococcota bacterium]|jgi:DNA repair exonuclease SbcCD nuclease subunit|nr:metallophosphoesterase [Myxococcota bacterium]
MTKLLAIGDVHLGTRPSGVAEDAADRGIAVQRLTPAAGLEAAVRLATEQDVSAVVFAGDVVESTNARYEAFRHLEAAVLKLLAEGVTVLGVVGNHDVEALPRLARLIPGFRIVGAGGRWECVAVEREGRSVCEVVGWSFPQRQVTSSPVADFAGSSLPPAQPGVPRIGVMHCDLDASGGPYAPVTMGELARTGIDTWLLGHIHKPSLGDTRSDNPGLRAGYLGSLVGLNPKEVGDRGPWLVDLAEGETSLTHVSNAPLRWETIDLAIEPDQQPEDLGDSVLASVDQRIRALHARGVEPSVLALRVRLTGTTRSYAAIDAWVGGRRWSDITRTVGATTAVVNKITNATELARDLHELAKGDDPPGLLARKLLILETEGAERDALIVRTRDRLRTLADASNFAPLQDLRDAADPLADEEITRALKAAGSSILSALLDQHEPTRRGEGAER